MKLCSRITRAGLKICRFIHTFEVLSQAPEVFSDSSPIHVAWRLASLISILSHLGEQCPPRLAEATRTVAKEVVRFFRKP